MTDRRITKTDHDAFGMGGLVNSPHFPGTTGFGSYIEQQEARGQRELVESHDLPVDTRGSDQGFLDLGFTFGEPHPHDPLFRPATLPEGWTRQATDHSMGGVIVDDKGRERVSIFYKAAFYDRCAHMYLVRPTARIDKLIWSDGEITGIELDELLTADAARDYLSRELTQAEDDLTYFPPDSDSYRGRVKRISRINKLMESLPGKN